MKSTDADYMVFVSHGTDDSWVAGQIAKSILEAGASVFLDETNTPKGANFKKLIHEQISKSRELVALFTPWSAKRSWVWIEMGAAWGQEKPVVAVLYGMRVSDLEESGGRAILEDINLLNLNEFDRYVRELADRVRGRKR